MVKKFLLRSLIAIFGVSTIVATGGSPKEPAALPPNYINVVQRSGDARCSCTNAKGWYITNSDTRERFVSYYYYTKNTLSGDVIDGRDSRLVPRASAGTPGETFLSCSIEQTGSLGCVLEHRYSRNRHVVGSTSSELSSFGFGPMQQSLEACKALCKSGHPRCFSMGPGLAKVTAPIVELYQDATSSGESKVDREEILAKYGIDPDEEMCERSDMELSNAGAEFQNMAVSGKACKIDAFERAALHLGLSAEESDELANLTLWMYPEIKGNVIRTLTSDGERDVVEFPVNDNGLDIEFTGAGGEASTKAFGSHVLAMQEVDNLLVIQTANGCISSTID